MKIGQNKVVEFCYELEVDGNVVDHTTKERPLDYIHGTGSLLPKLEEHIEGMEPGSRFDVTLSPADGYGEVDPQRIIDLPKAAFEVNGEIREDLLVPGNTIPMMNSMGGVIPGIVLEVTAETVKMDLNHQMAGKTLHFTGEVLTVREATERNLLKVCMENSSTAADAADAMDMTVTAVDAKADIALTTTADADATDLRRNHKP
jgi:FKBP-type peptidyl-prolyl cis-trans isomerase SlyD